MCYPKYPEYRDSGVEWLGKVPSGWSVRRLKFVASYNDEALPDTTEPDYEIEYVDISSVDLIDGIKSTESMLFEEAPSRARRVVENGDTVISTVRTYLKAIAYIEDAPDNLIASTGFAVIRPSEDIHPKFLAYALENQGFVDAIVSESVGVSYPAINATDLVCLPVAYPDSYSEQQAVADFLDHKTSQLDTLIAKKQQLIDKLNEKRIALITQAVTKGLDASVPMKGSGVEWLGEVPTHWDVRPLKFLADVRTGVTKGKDLGNQEKVKLPYMRVANVQDGFLDTSDLAEIEVAASEVSRFTLKKGDILMNEGGDNDKLGRGAVWQGEVEHCLHQNHVFAVRPEHESYSSWVGWVIQSMYAKFYFYLKANQSTNLASISATNLKMLPITLPDESERKAIEAYLDKELQRMEESHAAIRGAIERLGEYRTALITAAVTGKIDIRDVNLESTEGSMEQ